MDARSPVTLTIHPVPGLPEIEAGADLPRLVLDALEGAGLELEDGDVLVVTHKIVSKAEGAIRSLDGDDEDAAYRRLVLDEAAEVIRRRGDLVIAITEHGFICANAGVDRSNAADGTAVLLPRDPDRSAHRLRMALESATGARIAVVVSDQFGRPWRRGLTYVAIGVSSTDPILDLRGEHDMQGRELAVTEVAIVDEIAAAADLAMGKATGVPVALLRGLAWHPGDGRATDLVRPPEEDLFR
jgi:coenzyme F420-0:L-glutamate ligase/coenzyme F420-1:gamma-L-glutamate ligase